MIYPAIVVIIPLRHRNLICAHYFVRTAARAKGVRIPRDNGISQLTSREQVQIINLSGNPFATLQVLDISRFLHFPADRKSELAIKQ